MESIFGKPNQTNIDSGDYYAFTECFQVISNERIYIRLDCVKRELAEKLDSSKNIVRQIEEIPSVVFEINSRPEEFEKFTNINLEEDQWALITINNQGIGLRVFQTINGVLLRNLTGISIFQEGDPTVITKLETVFNLNSIDFVTEWSEETIQDWLSMNRKDPDSVSVYNVGQGNLNAVIDDQNVPLLYYDMGGGFGSCKETYPQSKTVKTCITYFPTVILSHWDLDHVETALRDIDNCHLRWLVPKQKIGTTHYKLAYAIGRNGEIMIWPVNQKSFSFGSFHIEKCTGTTKNNSGLSLLIKNLNGPIKNTLLPGDCDYKFILNNREIEINGLVAPHHGAELSGQKIPLAPGEHCLVYSYGLKRSGVKTHLGHPTVQSINFHLQNDWKNRHDTINGHIAMKRHGAWNVPCKRKCSLTIQQFI